MTLFKTWKKQKLVFSDADPTYRVKYLGNVQTGFMKGDGCVDKPTGVLWNNFQKNGQSVGLDMSLTICGSGMKAVTREQGLTEYRAHRIAYCIAHPKYPKLFVWVYRHEGKKMKVELRCHAVLCKSESKAKLMAVQLHDKLTFALNEFMREKTRKQSIRLTIERVNSKVSTKTGVSGHTRRTKFLSTAKNFRPSLEDSAGAPKLVAITEDSEEEAEEDTEDGDSDIGSVLMNMHPSISSLVEEDQSVCSTSSREGDSENAMYDLVMGNDIEQLKRDLQANPNDSDAESSESGFSEQGDNKDGTSSVLTRNGNCSTGHVIQNGGLLVAANISNNNSMPVIATTSRMMSSGQLQTDPTSRMMSSGKLQTDPVVSHGEEITAL